MDINTIRGLATLFALIAFVSMVVWAYSKKRKKDFNEAAFLPFADEHEDQAGMKNSRKEESKNYE